MAFEKGSEEYKMFAEYWEICKRYWLLIDDDEWWDEVTARLDDFCKKRDNDRFARDLAMALMNRLEMQSKRGKKT